MLLIVGLGNPGKKYEKTRHNVGRLVVSNWQQVEGLPDFKFEKKFNALISEGIFGEEKVVLAKPQTFMNLSGKFIKSLTKNYKLQTTNLFIVHDDIDLPLGKIKIVKNRGAAGHRGVESIIKELKTKDFIRFRVGICPKTGKPKNVEKFVLQKPSEGEDEGKLGRGKLHRLPSEAKPSEVGDETKSQRPFNKEEEKIVKEVIKKTVEAIEFTLKEGLEKAMSKYNK